MKGKSWITHPKHQKIFLREITTVFSFFLPFFFFYLIFPQQNHCLDSPCLNNGTCLSGFSEKKYLCVCQNGDQKGNCEKIEKPETTCKALYDKKRQVRVHHFHNFTEFKSGWVWWSISPWWSPIRLRRKGRMYEKKQGYKITSDLDYRNGSRTGFELKLSLHMIAGIISVVSLTLTWLNRHPVSRLYMPWFLLWIPKLC